MTALFLLTISVTIVSFSGDFSLGDLTNSGVLAFKTSFLSTGNFTFFLSTISVKILFYSDDFSLGGSANSGVLVFKTSFSSTCDLAFHFLKILVTIVSFWWKKIFWLFSKEVPRFLACRTPSWYLQICIFLFSKQINSKKILHVLE